VSRSGYAVGQFGFQRDLILPRNMPGDTIHRVFGGISIREDILP
jgi:hypothetical protein